MWVQGMKKAAPNGKPLFLFRVCEMRSAAAHFAVRTIVDGASCDLLLMGHVGDIFDLLNNLYLFGGLLLVLLVDCELDGVCGRFGAEVVHASFQS